MPNSQNRLRISARKKHESINSKRNSFKKAPIDYVSHMRVLFKKLQELKEVTRRKNSVRRSNTGRRSRRRSKYQTPRSPFTLTDSLLKRNSSKDTRPRNVSLELQSSKFMDLFILHENDVCTSRTIFRELWDKNTFKNVKNTEQHYEVKRNIIKHVLFMMNTFDWRLFKIILKKNSLNFPCLCYYIDDRKRLLFFLLALMRQGNDAVNHLTEILQLWYIVQPAILESLKYTNGKITEEIEPFITNVDELYDWLSNKKKEDNSARILCSVYA